MSRSDPIRARYYDAVELADRASDWPGIRRLADIARTEGPGLALTGIASALSILPVAVAVEHAETLAALHALGFRGVQGEAVAAEILPLR